jgi:Yip1 domain
MARIMASTQDGSTQPPAPPLGEGSRLLNVFVDPKLAFADIAARPGWWVPMIAVMVCMLALMIAFSSHVGWERFMRQQMESQPKMQNLSPEDRERALEMQIKFGAPIGTVMAVVAPPVSMLVTAGVLLFVFNNLLGASVKFRQALGVTAYAWLPNVLGMAGAVLVMFLKDPVDFDLKNPAGYNVGFFLDPHAVPAWLVSLGTSIDVFSLWVILLLATGMAAVTRKPWATALTGVLIPWAAFVFLKVGWAAIF